MKTSKRLMIAFAIAIVLSAVIGVLLYFHTINLGREFRWTTVLSNTFFITGVAYIVALLCTLLSRSGVFGHLVYAIKKLRKNSLFAQKYKSYPQYLKEHTVSTYSLIIYWLPAAVFIAVAILFALLA